MKNTFKLLFTAILISGLWSCEDEQELIFSNPPASFEIVTPLDGSVFLEPDRAGDIALTVTWNDADFGDAIIANYDVEISLPNAEFASPIVAGNTTNNFVTWTVEELNGAATLAGVEPFTDTPQDISIRVKAYLGTNQSEIVYSNVITVGVTTYTTETPLLYVVGNFLAAGGYGNDWTPSSAVPLASSGFGETDFEGYVFFNAASFEYKFLPTNVSFDGDYGDDGNFSGTLVQEGEVNCTGTGAGYYRVQADTDLLTYLITPTAWGIVGAATPGGWDNSTALTYNSTSKKWEGTVVMTAGGYKFRANNAWTVNLGGSTDSLTYNGPDLILDASGTYLVKLDLSNPRAYSYELIAQ
ncbi:SusE domain-containing protein [Flavobacterium lacus]|uniref:SusE-like outer membrane protein n=1 Tax=Flavobacterium lacus TaxID=1353778 RepID=A0A328X4M6_9FLAO|nr:SusE domain-containing protein [Flavobacterium lacus]RAR50298.1 SusE-like outer membrane protein [Flavobacterium lacus]